MGLSILMSYALSFIAMATESLPSHEIRLSQNHGTTFIKKKTATAQNAAPEGDTDAEVVYKTSSVSAATGYITTYTWTPCPSESPFLEQGGFKIDSTVSLVASYRYNSSTWKWKVVNTSGSNKTISLYAVCTIQPDEDGYDIRASTTMYMAVDDDGDGYYTKKVLTTEIPPGVEGIAIGDCYNADQAIVDYGFQVTATDGSTPTSGSLTELYVEDGTLVAFWYNASSKSVKITLPYVCMTHFDSWWFPAYVENNAVSEEETVLVNPYTQTTQWRTCDSTSNSDTIGGGQTLWLADGQKGYTDEFFRKIKTIGDYFSVQSDDLVYWYGKLYNGSSIPVKWGMELTCATE